MVHQRLSSNFLPNALGELELAILQILWESPNLSAKTITETVSTQRKVKLSTVQSSLENLRTKELVIYKKSRQAFVYQATVSRSDLLGRFVNDVIHRLHDGKLDTILSSFVYVAANINDKALDDLERLIKEAREKDEGKKP